MVVIVRTRFGIIDLHIFIDNMLRLMRGRRCLRIERHARLNGSEFGPLDGFNGPNRLHVVFNAIWMSTFHSRIDRHPSTLGRSRFGGVVDFWCGWVGERSGPVSGMNWSVDMWHVGGGMIVGCWVGRKG
jgi:hypothetical protein